MLISPETKVATVIWALAILMLTGLAILAIVLQLVLRNFKGLITGAFFNEHGDAPSA